MFFTLTDRAPTITPQKAKYRGFGCDPVHGLLDAAGGKDKKKQNQPKTERKKTILSKTPQTERKYKQEKISSRTWNQIHIIIGYMYYTISTLLVLLLNQI